MDTAPEEAERHLLAALTSLVADWASIARQAEIARRAGVDVDPVDVQPLYALGQLGPQRASVLADALRLSRPTMSKQLRRLTDAGLVERAPDPADARASTVSLSATGAEAYDRLVREGIAIVRTALSEWHDPGADAFAHDLSRFVSALTGGPVAADQPRTAGRAVPEEKR
ncbi:MarR family winged helix-turn-helix transcriptional regulator [Leifsonia xyli]|uniref:MarR family winged helix-turn-helix transcriptional regulator n=1 Tax=Leifsonia xyli TaxID=1575 RepID=UPI003D678C59